MKKKRWLGFIGDLSSSDAGIREEINKLPHMYGFPMLRVTHSQPSLRSKTSERCFIRFNFYTTKQNTSMTHSSNQCIREIRSTIKSWNGSRFATSDSTEQARYVGQKRSWRRPRGTDPPPNRYLISGWVSTTFLLGICDLWWGILYFGVCIWDEGFCIWDDRFGVWNVFGMVRDLAVIWWIRDVGFGSYVINLVNLIWDVGLGSYVMEMGFGIWIGIFYFRRRIWDLAVGTWVVGFGLWGLGWGIWDDGWRNMQLSDGFGILDLGCGILVWDLRLWMIYLWLGFGTCYLGFGTWDEWFMDLGLGAWGLGFRVCDLEFMVRDLGWRMTDYAVMWWI